MAVSTHVPTPDVALEDTYFPPRFGLIEFIRRMRTDQLSLLPPELLGRNLLHSRLLFLHSFLVNKPEYIEHVLLTNHANYRKSDFLRRMLGPLLGEGLLISEGEVWRRRRRIAAPAFHARRIAELVATMASCTDAMLARWATMPQPFDVAGEMMSLTLDVISRTMFSADVSRDVATVRRLMDVVVKLRVSLLDLFGFPQWLPRFQPKEFRRAIAEFDTLVSRLIAERRAGTIERDDLLGMLLAARDADTGERLSERELRDEALTVFVAGHETTANALSWVWYLLARHPEAEARLHEEVDRVLGGRAPGYADLDRLAWTRMVIDEAMRLYPPAHAVSRTAIGEDRIGGVRIPPGSNISVSMYMTHRNPNLWKDPERFDPERFTPTAIAQRHRFAYLPFGGGPRICIGNGFAIAEAQVIVAMVTQRYQLRLAPGHMVEPIGLITLRPKNGVWVTLEPRASRPRPPAARPCETSSERP
jgi:cytochrome P450